MILLLCGSISDVQAQELDVVWSKSTDQILWCGDFGPTGEQVASGGSDGVTMWRASDGEILWTAADRAWDMAFSPDGTLLALSDDQWVVLLVPVDGREVRRLGVGSKVYGLAFTPDGQKIVTGSMNGTVQLWRVSDGTKLATLSGHQSPVYGVAVSPDGTLMASCDGVGAVKLWTMPDGQFVRNLLGQRFSWKVAFSVDGAFVVSGGWLDPCRVWRVSDGQLQRVMDVSGLLTLDFSSEGDLLATGSLDQEVV